MKFKYLIIPLTLLYCCQQQNTTNPRVVIATEMGNIELEVYLDKAPITAANFMAYVDSGKYNNAAYFYRVVRPDNQPHSPVKIEVIQGGFFQDSLIEKYQLPPIPHETTRKTGIRHKDGTLSMARYTPGTASSEFFICIGNNYALDYDGARNSDGQGFAAFGRVVKGMDVVRAIQQQRDTSQYLVNPVKIISVRRAD
jgi:peptidyl-prolyl cis-trans isomerase A (cyclophilin A)